MSDEAPGDVPAPTQVLRHQHAVPAVVLPAALGEWACQALRLVDDAHLEARFRRPDGSHIEVTVGPKGGRTPAFMTLERCAVRYQGRLTQVTPQARLEVAALVRAVGLFVDERLRLAQEVVNERSRLAQEAAPGGVVLSLADALGRRHPEAEVVFSRDSLRALLAPEIAVGAVLAGGFSLVDVYPDSRLPDGTLRLVLDFRSDTQRMRIGVGPTREGARGFAQTTHLTLTHDAPLGEEPAAASLVRALVGFVLQLRDHEGLRIVFPDPAEDVGMFLLAAPAAAADGEPGALNIDLTSECFQQCSFCSLKELSPARDGGAEQLRELYQALAASRDRGVSHLRLLGYDPLTFSGVKDVLLRARQLGYRRVEIYSPCTTLADASFCRAIVALLPQEYCFYVPLYGVTPAVHDAVVGRPGAHALVLAALAALEPLVPPGAVRLISVALRDNLAELPALADFATRRGIQFSAILPYPSQEAQDDGFVRTMPRFTDVARALAEVRRGGHVVRIGLRTSNGPRTSGSAQDAAPPQVRVEGLPPCVAFEHLGVEEVSAQAWLEFEDGDGARAEPIAAYTDAPLKVIDEPVVRQYHAAMVPCPHASRCALRSSCSQEILRSYVELYGVGELAPISLGALLQREVQARRTSVPAQGGRGP